jgi:hypothetical protein
MRVFICYGAEVKYEEIKDKDVLTIIRHHPLGCQLHLNRLLNTKNKYFSVGPNIGKNDFTK